MIKLISISLVFVSIIVASPAAAEPAKYICGFSKKMMCKEETGCVNVPADEILVQIIPKENAYVRCGYDGCSSLKMLRSGEPGRYTTIDIPGRGAFAKLSPTGEITEVTSLAGDTLVSFGSCYDAALVQEPAPAEMAPGDRK